MANQPLGFAEIFAGGILLLAGISGDSIGNVVKGSFTWPPKPFGNTTSTPSGSGGTTFSGDASSANVPNEANAAINNVAAQMGWDSSEIAAWKGVIAREDGSYSLTAKNPGSNAYGIAQFINGPSEYYTYGGDPNTYSGQITAMANYILSRYGTPSAALAHEQSNNWY